MGNLRLRHRPDHRSRNRRVRLRPVMQGTAGFFSTVNTKETDWALTEQERGKEKEWKSQRKTNSNLSHLIILDCRFRIGSRTFHGFFFYRWRSSRWRSVRRRRRRWRVSCGWRSGSRWGRWRLDWLGCRRFTERQTFYRSLK